MRTNLLNFVTEGSFGLQLPYDSPLKGLIGKTDIEKKKEEYQEVELISAGSALKFCIVAEGGADIYIRTGRTMEWDTAAGHIVSEEAGKKVLILNSTEPLIYNKEDLANPWFVVQ